MSNRLLGKLSALVEILLYAHQTMEEGQHFGG